MKGFKLSYYNQSSLPIFFSQYDPINPNYHTITYNENLVENENDQYTLTFSITRDDSFNLNDIFRIGRKLKLECENHEGDNYIDLVISSISPEGNSDNIIYNITATDYVSYIFSKNNIGLTFDTLTDEEWINLEVDNNIYNIGNYLLRRGYLQKISSYTLIYNTLYENISVENIQDLKITKKYQDYIQFNFDIVGISPLNFDISVNAHSSGITHTTPALPNSTINITVALTRNNFEYMDIMYATSMGENIIKKYVFKFEGNIIKYYEKTVSYSTGAEISEVQALVIHLMGNMVYFRQYYQSPNLTIDSWKIVEDSLNPVLWQKVNLELSDSNTYNGLIELSNLSESLLYFNYKNKTIEFIDKDSYIFNTNYQLSPYFNLQDFSLTYDGNEFYPILYAEGGEDEYKQIVTLIPFIPYSTLQFLKDNIINNINYDIDVTTTLPTNYYSKIWEEGLWFSYLNNKNIDSQEYIDTMNFINIANKIPYIDSFILNLQYFYDNNLLSLIQYQSLLDYFYNDLRKTNIKLQDIQSRKNNTERNIDKLENDLDIKSELLISEDKTNFNSKFDDFIKIFYNNTAINDPTILTNILTAAEINALTTTEFIEMQFPSSFTINSISKTTDENGILKWNNFIINGDGTTYYGTLTTYDGQIYWDGKNIFHSIFQTTIYHTIRSWLLLQYPFGRIPKITVEAYSDLPNLNEVSGYKDGDIALVMNNNNPIYYIVSSYNQYQSTSTYSPTISLISSQVKYKKIEYSLLDIYPLFENYNRYNGFAYVDKRYHFYEKKLINYIKLRKEKEQELINLNKLLLLEADKTSDNYIELSSQITNAEQERIRYESASGKWDYDEINSEFINYVISLENIPISSEDSHFIRIDFSKGIPNTTTKTIENLQKIIVTSYSIGVAPESFIYTIDGNEYEINYVPTQNYPGYSTGVYVTTNWDLILTDETWNNVYSNGLENYGKFCYIVKYFEQYFTQYQNDPSYYHYYTNNILTQYNIIKEEKDTLWYNIKLDFGQYLYEGYYSNTVESNSLQLYNQTILYAENYKEPTEDYNITYLDGSNIIGENIDLVKIGDKINIVNVNLGILKERINEIQVISISKNLRENSNIQLTVSRRKNLNYLEKLLGIIK